jgi:hypothetical protein
MRMILPGLDSGIHRKGFFLSDGKMKRREECGALLDQGEEKMKTLLQPMFLSVFRKSPYLVFIFLAACHSSGGGGGGMGGY